MLTARDAVRLRALVVMLGLLLSACDGLFTGTQVVRFPLQSLPGGGYAPVRLALGPEMNPIALNFAADYTVNPAESGKWNSYTAVLSLNGKTVARGTFNINNSNSPDAPGGAPSVAHTMLIVEAAETGDYELRIALSSAAQITLNNANVELRRNIRPAPK